MATTAVSICNAALFMAGSEDINSFSDNTEEARLAGSIYEDTKQFVLQYHPWRFSFFQKDLGGALIETPVTDEYDNIYQLPPDFLRLSHVDGNEDYKLFQDKIYTDANPCLITYQANISEGDMPAFFVRPLQFELASIFVLALQEDARKADLFEKRAKSELMRAKNIDAQQQPNEGIPDTNYTLLNIRG